MKKLISASAVTLVLTATLAGAGGYAEPTPAAVPVPVPVVDAYDWSGFYGGASFATVDPRGTSTAGAADDDPFDEDQAFGVFAGYLMQSGQIVYGGELGYTLYQSDFTDFPGFGIEDILEIRGRVGYAFDRLLLSGSVGFAAQVYDDGGVEPLTMTGLTYGVGADYALTDSLFMGAEYVVRDIEGENTIGTQMGVVDQSLRLRVGFSF